MQAPTPAANSAFRLTFEELLARAPAGTVRHHDFVRVPSNQKPWLDTGIDLAAGETVTTIGSGQTPHRDPALLRRGFSVVVPHRL